MMSSSQWGILILRLGLAAVFLWFGFSQLLDGVNWVGWVPEWAVNLLHLPPAMVVLGNGAFEVIAGTLLALGIWVRPIALLLGLHLVVITIEVGLSPIGVRDFGLTMATFALALLGKNEQDLDK
ncbi:MAG: DoxX family protein [Patescibacteria group bacterium]